MKRVYNKSVVAGNVLELTSFQKGVSINEKKDDENVSDGGELEVIDDNNCDVDSDKKNSKKRIVNISIFERLMRDLENYQRSIRRTKQLLVRSINANFGKWSTNMKDNKFMTLTFRGEVTDYDYANKEFKQFIERLNYFAFKQKKKILKYTAVIEHHHENDENNGIHYHVIFYNLPFVEHADLLKIWRGKRGTGGLNIKVIDHVDNVGAYVTKYVEKEIKDSKKFADSLYDEMLMIDKFSEDKKEAALKSLLTQFAKFEANKGKKVFQQSQKLLKAETDYLNDEEIDAIVYEMKNRNDVIEVADTVFDNEFTGETKYRQFKMKKGSRKTIDDVMKDVMSKIVNDEIEENLSKT